MVGIIRGKRNFSLILNIRALADVLYIFPLKADRKNFDDNKEELGFASKPKVAKYVKTAADIENERVAKLKEEENQIKGKIIF